jgi:hypothetical protein
MKDLKTQNMQEYHARVIFHAFQPESESYHHCYSERDLMYQAVEGRRIKRSATLMVTQHDQTVWLFERRTCSNFLAFS